MMIIIVIVIMIMTHYPFCPQASIWAGNDPVHWSMFLCLTKMSQWFIFNKTLIFFCWFKNYHSFCCNFSFCLLANVQQNLSGKMGPTDIASSLTDITPALLDTQDGLSNPCSAESYWEEVKINLLCLSYLDINVISTVTATDSSECLVLKDRQNDDMLP